MVQPKILGILNKGLISSVIVSAFSFFIPLVPCTTSPVIEVPDYKFSMCKLPNPFTESLLGISQKFYGAFTEPLAGLVLQFILILIIILVILSLFNKKSGKILDLTQK